MFSSIIISGALAQDHEFIYPFYRLLEANSKLDVCLIGGKPVQGILGTSLPPNKNHPVKDIDQVKVNDYDLLVLPGGVKALEKTRQNKKSLDNVMLEFVEKIGTQRLAAVHANDAKSDLGSKLDRHENIGDGFIGMDGWETIVSHESFFFVNHLIHL